MCSWACTKTRNGETKPLKRNERNSRNKRNETKRNETEGKHRNETKPPNQDETTEMTQNTVKYKKKMAIYGAKTVRRVFPGLLSCDNTMEIKRSHRNESPGG